jgi:hypothetical protein
MGTAVNLAKGSWEVAKASAKDRLSTTTGGKIAEAINKRAAAVERAAGVQFDDNSLSAGGESADRESEVAAFRDRNSKTSS